MYITYLIIFSLFGAFYGALSYGLNSQFIGDLPRCVDDNASFYIIIRNDYQRVIELYACPFIPIIILIISFAMPLAMMGLKSIANRSFAMIGLILAFIIFACAVHYFVMARIIPKYNLIYIDYNKPINYHHITKRLIFSIKLFSISGALFIVYCIAFALVLVIPLFL
jgi:hypothetical protein